MALSPLQGLELGSFLFVLPSEPPMAHQLKAARALARLDQQELSNRSGVSVPTIKRMEAGDGPIRGNYENVAAVVGVLEAAVALALA
jgi:predicted transcriptional regulator